MKKLLSEISSKIVSIEKNVNTNNAWGFGGAIKDVYILNNGYSLHIGVCYYRHLKPTKLIKVCNEKNINIAEGLNNVREVLQRMYGL